MEFFPPNTLDEQPDRNAFRERWYAAHLVTMQERPCTRPQPTNGTCTGSSSFPPSIRRPLCI
jgi:hypothetical protein